MSPQRTRPRYNTRKENRKVTVKTYKENFVGDPDNALKSDRGKKYGIRGRMRRGRGRCRGRPRGSGQVRQVTEYKQINITSQLYTRWQEVKKLCAAISDSQFVKKLLDTFE